MNGTQGVLRMVTETDKLIVTRIGGLLRFRGKVGVTDQIEMVVATSPIALDTMVYVTAHFKPVRKLSDQTVYVRT